MGRRLSLSALAVAFIVLPVAVIGLLRLNQHTPPFWTMRSSMFQMARVGGAVHTHSTPHSSNGSSARGGSVGAYSVAEEAGQPSQQQQQGSKGLQSQQEEEEEAARQQQEQGEQLEEQGAKGSGGAAPVTTSSYRLHVTPGKHGGLTDYYTKFYNVHFSRRTGITFFRPPGMEHPRDYWVNIIKGNGSQPRPPTMVVLYGSGLDKHEYRYLPVRYVRAGASRAPVCTQWVDKPTYLLQVRYSHNIWHSWGEGLAKVFSTLREQGYLPLAHVDAQGNVTAERRGQRSGCWVWDEEKQQAAALPNCPPAWEGPAKCDPLRDAWCHEGLVAYNRTNGPVLMTYSAAVMKNKWAHMYRYLSEDIRDSSDMTGWCFRELVVGSTNTLNYYQKLLAPKGYHDHVNARVESMHAFKMWAHTAQKRELELLDAQREGEPAWTGYADPRLEQLRQGIGPEDRDSVLLPPGPPRGFDDTSPQVLEELGRLWGEWVRVLRRKEVEWRARTAPSPPPPMVQPPPPRARGLDYRLELPRPVVVYMSRNFSGRGVFNEEELMRYILSRYNVTLRVTTFEEPAVVAMDMLSQTDVLLGMHGAGWTNALFLKHGATALQIFPYGFRHPAGPTIRGETYHNVVKSVAGQYFDWVNPRAGYAFLRRFDFVLGNGQYSEPPRPHPLPRAHTSSHPGKYLIYQNTLLDLDLLGPHVDKAFAAAGIGLMPRYRARRG